MQILLILKILQPVNLKNPVYLSQLNPLTMRCFFLIGTLLISLPVLAQDFGFPYGQVTYKQLNMERYDSDTSAAAVVLNEFGMANIDNGGDHNLMFYYHVRIKILKTEGLKYANIEIPLHKNESRQEFLRSVKASSFNVENGTMRENTVDLRNVFTENRGQYYDIKKLAIPNVRVGTVIEFHYTLESPFIFNFRNWEFQSEVPKVVSDYWASIPGNYVYNITLKGYLKLTTNESSLVKECFTPGGGQRADCALFKYGMKNVPAFVEEDYMTAKSNFIASINFELSELHYFDGRVDKITKEWKDTDQEFKKHPQFGAQLRRGKDLGEDQIDPLVKGETDEMKKAKKIYQFMQGWFRWDEHYGKYSESIKKAFDKKVGNVADINLSLVAALRYADIDAEPVILSTRDNGEPTELHPVMSDFNYVVAKVNIGGKTYLADATDDFLPFGLLPKRCLNGKGRALGEKESYWVELKPADRSKRLSIINLKLDADGMLRGTIQTTYMGYRAVDQRKKLNSFSSIEDYTKDLKNNLHGIEIKKIDIENRDNFDMPLVQKLDVEVDAFDNLDAATLFFNPFLLGKWEQNPFKSSDRLYPVDFGAPFEDIMLLNVDFPEAYEIVDPPERTALSLPNAGGRYLFEVQNSGNRLSANSSLSINKSIFTSAEYKYVKELFSRIIQVENGDIIFKKKI
jgi:hypothetical protein